jgi:hypothetical protein
MSVSIQRLNEYEEEYALLSQCFSSIEISININEGIITDNEIMKNKDIINRL